MIDIGSTSQRARTRALIALCGAIGGCAPGSSATSGEPPGAGAGAPAAKATQPAAAPDEAAPGLLGSALRLLDVDGEIHALGPNDPRPAAFVFLSPDCPIAREAVPTLAALAAATPEPELRVFGVLAGRGVTRADARAFVRAYGIAFPVLLDASGLLADRLRPTVTPEAFVVDADGQIVYRGRIDDTYAALGKRRPAATSRDLAQAIERARRGAAAQPPVVTPPVGCFVEPARGAAAAQPTYARDIAPILSAYCADCHRQGGVAPFSLVSQGDARQHADTIVTATQSRYMPPLHAVPGVGRYLDQRWLGDAELALLEAWTKTGLLPGDDADLPPARTFPPATKWPLGEPDLILKMPRAYSVPATGADLYRSFVLGTIPGERMIIAIDIQPGVRQVVHHAGVYQDTQGIARKLEAKAGFGYEGQAMAGLGYGARLRTWAAGVAPRMLPDGMGQPVQKGADLVLELHYRPTGKVEHDQSKVGVYFARRPVQQPVGAVPMVTTDIDIPPDDPYFRVPVEKTIETPSTLLSIRPHMHRLGKDLKATAILPSGESLPLLLISHWDYQWQPVYVLSRAIPLPAGTVLRLECFFDNSAANPLNPSSPPRRVGFGWKVTEEMCAMYPELAFGSREDLRRWTSTARASSSMPVIPD
ncbi:MAG TPA: redoxin domain-containing protein [Kofleriaceae bacterium]|nr:redoxin domain-containing protein [Kofleriaceae bacterium]